MSSTTSSSPHFWLTFLLTYFWTFFLTSFLRHSLWTSFRQIFWHSWHIFEHSFWHPFSDILSELLSDISSDIPDIFLTILSDILSQTFFLNFFQTYLLTFFLTYLVTSCNYFFETFFLQLLLILSIAVEVRHATLNSRDRGWGPARHTELTGSRLRSGTPHWTHGLAVGVRHATLNSQDRGWGPARHTELTGSRLRSGTPHWTHKIVVEVRHITWTQQIDNEVQREEKDEAEEEEEEEEEEERRTAHIKSNNPHLTGGEQSSKYNSLIKKHVLSNKKHTHTQGTTSYLNISQTVTGWAIFYLLPFNPFPRCVAAFVRSPDPTRQRHRNESLQKLGLSGEFYLVGGWTNPSEKYAQVTLGEKSYPN